MNALLFYIRISLCFFLLSFFLVRCSSETKRTEDLDVIINEINKSTIKRPIKKIRAIYERYKLLAEKDTVLIYETGTKIHIPANAFLDENGNIIKGEVELKYRELHNALDFYLSGVPMTYKSGNVEKVFESAGMCEINAYKKGSYVRANPDNRITLEMASFFEGGDYNYYSLDTISNQWQEQGKDSIVTSNYNDEIEKLPPVPPEPKIASNIAFKIIDATNAYPELKMYKDVLFDPVDKRECGYDATTVKITKGKIPGTYDIRFIVEAFGELVADNTCTCYLAFREGNNYNDALQLYQNKYKNKIAERKTQRKKIQEEWANYLTIKEKWKIRRQKDEMEALEGQEKISRFFEINGFGYHNIDKLISYPNIKLLADFSDKKGNPIQLDEVTMIAEGTNSIFRYTSEVCFSPNMNNLLFGVTKNNKFAYFSAADFKKIKETTGKYTFRMKVISIEMNTYDDVQAVLVGKKLINE